MHEVSIAMSILKIVEEELAKNNAQTVVQVHLQIGALSGVVPESLLFALEVSKQDGILKNAEIIIDTQDAMALCRICGAEFATEDYFSVCPHCLSPEYEITTGRDLIIKSLSFV